MQQRKTELGRYQIFTLTFLSYAFLHSMRMGYAQVKPEFQSFFQLTHLQLGLFDAAIYLAVGIGCLLRFKIQTKKNLIKTFFISMTVACLAFLYIPLSSLLLGERVRDSFLLKEALPGISLLVFGFFQFSSYPTLLTIINYHFDVKREGDIIGAWSGSGDIGNILGLAISGVMITILHLKWQYLLLSVTIFNWLGALLIYLNIDQDLHHSRPSDEVELQQNGSHQAEGSGFDQFWDFVKHITRKQQNKLYLLSMGLLKSILYAFLLWIPTYLTANHFAYYKSTVPIFFNIGGLFGSFILGYFYKNVDFEQDDLVSRLFNHFKIYSMFQSCFGVTAIFDVFYVFKLTIVVFLLLSMVCGAFLGGCFNMLCSNQAISIVKGHRVNISKLSTLAMATNNLLVGIVQLLIGVILNIKASTNGYNILFMILVSIGVIAMLALLRRSHLLSRNEVKQEYQTLE